MSTLHNIRQIEGNNDKARFGQKNVLYQQLIPRTLLVVILAWFFGSICAAQDFVTTELMEDVAATGQLLRETRSNAAAMIRDSATIQECWGRTEEICIRPQDDLWIINARHCTCDSLSLENVHVKHFSCGMWQPSTLQDLTNEHGSRTDVETVIYIHGNRTDERWSVSRGLQLYKNVFCDGYESPVRYVIFQWKSEQECSRNLQDYLIKSKRSIRVGKTLALILQQFPDRNLTVVSYSLGVQVVLSAFCEPFGDQDGTQPGYRVALIAPALDCDFAHRMGNFSSSQNVVDRSVLFFNRHDRVIKLSEMVCRRRNGRQTCSFEDAITWGCISLGSIEKIDVACETGKKHSIVGYSESQTLRNAINQLVSYKPNTLLSSGP